MNRIFNMIMSRVRGHGPGHGHHHHHPDQHQMRDDNFSSGTTHSPRHINHGHHGHGHHSGGMMSMLRRYFRL